MKHVIASLTIGACLVLPLAGVVLAADPHKVTGTTGQPGTGTATGVSCSVYGVTPGNSGSSNGSPFNANVAKTYAGNPGNPTGPGGNANNSPHAVSEYDVACFQQTVKQMP
jgi:hypothetical protein